MKAALALLIATACGDNLAMPDAAPAPDILAELRALPGVTVTENLRVNAPAPYRYFTLQITQPVDHAAPDGPTFQQEVSLIHLDAAAPMIAFTTGYDDYWLDAPAEPTAVLRANQISIEHRFFGTSRPDPEDWSKATIAQMAADEHAIIQLLKPIYGAAWIASGGSKGGLTAVFHRRFYPDDVAGTLAYVAPLSFGVPDHRYDVLYDLASPTCRQNVRAVSTEMLQHRRAALEALAQTQAAAMGYTYTRVAIGPAVESAVNDLEWSFWQYDALGECPHVPATTATDDALFAFLDQISPVSFSDDDSSHTYEAYWYQVYTQLGEGGTTVARGDVVPPNLAPLARYSDADFAQTFPAGAVRPPFDPTAIDDIDDWVQTSGDKLLFVYGQLDPWTYGAFRLGDATDSLEVVTPNGTHDDGMLALSDADRAAAFAKLAAWTGVTPQVPAAADQAALHRTLTATRRRHR
jgi:hypothetical protein